MKESDKKKIGEAYLRLHSDDKKKHMTPEEAIKELREASDSEVRYGDTEHHYDEVMKRVEALDLAIKALKQQPKTGHWIETAEEYYKAVNECGGGVNADTLYFVDDIACSKCLSMFSIIDNETERFDYCPNCGADMRGEKNEME